MNPHILNQFFNLTKYYMMFYEVILYLYIYIQEE